MAAILPVSAVVIVVSVAVVFIGGARRAAIEELAFVERSEDDRHPEGVDGTVTVRAFGTLVEGEWPEIQVWVNGRLAEPRSVIVDSPTLADFSFTTDNMTDEPQVEVAFVNDGYAENGPGTADNLDRNLMIDYVLIDDRPISPDDPRVVTDWGWGEEAFDGVDTEPGRFSIYGAGALRIDAYEVEMPTPPEPRDPIDAEMVYQEDFSSGFINTLDWRIYDEGGNAGWGLRRPSAFTVEPSPEAERGGNLLRVTAAMGEGEEADSMVSGGMILGSIAQTYGRFTIRVRTEPDPERVTTGVILMWPDSDNDPPYDVWPTGGEIDWHEGWRDRQARKPIDLVSHYVIDGVHNAESINLRTADGEFVDGSQWHTYQLDWRPDYLAVSVDGGPPNVLTDDPAKIPQWNMHMTVQLDGWQAIDNPGHQPTIDEPVSMWVDWITIERYPAFE
jgi:hypothetical protein